MKAFYGSQELKQRTLDELDEHRDADRIIQGRMWRAGRGCAVGCIVKTTEYPHRTYEEMLGVPKELAYIQDAIFEGLDIDFCVDFPSDFISAIPVGADLSKVYLYLLQWILLECEKDFNVDRENTPTLVYASERIKFFVEELVEGEKILDRNWEKLWDDLENSIFCTYSILLQLICEHHISNPEHLGCRDGKNLNMVVHKFVFNIDPDLDDYEINQARVVSVKDKLIQLLKEAPVS